MLKRIIRPKMVKSIIFINIGVFLLWTFFYQTYPAFYFNNFLVSWTGLTNGLAWTAITSVFSHNAFFHLFINMYIFLGFGIALEMELGSMRFLRFYLTAGVIASVTHAAVSNILLAQPDLPALGASGAIAGVVMVFSLMFPKEKILIFGIIPVPAIWGVLLMVGIDLWGLFEQTKGGTLPIGHGAHLGGAFTGLFYYLFFLRHKKRV